MFRIRELSGIMRNLCFRRNVAWIIFVILFSSIFLNFLTKFGNIDDFERIRFHKRRLTFDTDIIHSRCNSSHETGTSGLSRKPVDLRIFVLTYNRPSSVQRLLKSLNNAIYGNSSVFIEVWVDRSESGQVHRDTVKVLKGFEFKHGGYRVCVHAKHAGILGQWLTPWKAEESDYHEIAVLLEDDMTLSPYFYTYLKHVHSKYSNSPKINGFTLQGLSMRHYIRNGFWETDISISPKDLVHLYPTLGTWGFSPNRKNWVMFLKWFEYKYNDRVFNPIVQKHVAADWYRDFIAEGSEDHFWEVWHIYFAWVNQEFTMYPNFIGHKSLTFNWKENGLHYSDQNVIEMDADKNNLLMEWKSDYNTLPDNVVVVDNDGSILTRLDLS